jgi:protein-S-isoprenylcysteine O-methyltransferase Ste14
MSALETRFPPVILALCFSGLMWFLDSFVPSLRFALPGQAMIAILAALFGALVGLLGVAEFRRARTSVNPLRPGVADSLVTSGIFRRTRNPMYLGLLFGLLAWGLWLGNAASLTLLPLFVAYMNRFQIGPEESVLENGFSAEFNEYRRRVRRWL